MLQTGREGDLSLLARILPLPPIAQHFGLPRRLCLHPRQPASAFLRECPAPPPAAVRQGPPRRPTPGAPLSRLSSLPFTYHAQGPISGCPAPTPGAPLSRVCSLSSTHDAQIPVSGSKPAERGGRGGCGAVHHELDRQSGRAKEGKRRPRPHRRHDVSEAIKIQEVSCVPTHLIYLLDV
jgi:hypothetical protein